MTDRNEPLRLMDEIEHLCKTDGNEWTLDADHIQSLRTALEAQRDELAQKDARIARLDEGLVDCCKTITDFLCGDETEEDLHGCLVRVITLREEHPRQSAAALKAEALHKTVEELGFYPTMFSKRNEGWNNALHKVKAVAERIEREAKEQGEQQ